MNLAKEIIERMYYYTHWWFQMIFTGIKNIKNQLNIKISTWFCLGVGFEPILGFADFQNWTNV